MSSSRLAFLAVAVLLAACGSAPPPVPAVMADIDPLEQDAINALDLKLDDQAAQGLDNALRHYQSLDHLAGQWRIHLTRTKLANARGDAVLAEAEVDKLAQLAHLLGSPEADFETLILLGQIKKEPRYFQSALAIAPSPVQRAVVLTYLNRSDDAMKLIDPTQTDRPDDRAFIYFRYALKTGNASDMQRALEAYKIAEDSRGVADALMHLARISARNNDSTQARVYGDRAMTVLTSIGDAERAAAVKNWLDQL